MKLCFGGNFFCQGHSFLHALKLGTVVRSYSVLKVEQINVCFFSDLLESWATIT